MIYGFASFELDLEAFELRKAGKAVDLEPRAFDLLRLLIEQRGRVVAKGEILERVWPTEVVTEGSIHRTINHLRTALGQRRRRGGPIETVHGRGYRFNAVVQAVVERSPAALVEVVRSPAIPAAGAAPGQPEPFLGRSDVLRRLESALGAVRTGQQRLCVLTGEAGIGKTHCTHEFERRARSEGCSVWRVSCAVSAIEPPLWPWLQILRSCAVEEERAAFGSEMRAVIAEIEQQLAQSESRESQANIGGFPLLDRIVQLVLAAGAWRPRVIILDDLHHAQDAALRTLGLLAATPSASRVLVVATLRDEHAARAPEGGALRRALRTAERIAIEGLSAAEIAQYVGAVAGIRCSPETTALLYAKTRGNPLFLRELLHLLLGRHGPARMAELDPDSLGVPDAVREVVRERVRVLGEPTRELLGMASAIGESFALPVLLDVSELPAPAALDALDEAVTQRLIQRSSALGTYSFSHGLIADTLYEDLPSPRRSEIHAKIAASLEARSPAPGVVQLDALALHFHHALPFGDPGKAAAYCSRAAEAAARSFAYHHSVRLSRWALEAESFASPVQLRRCAERTYGLAYSQLLAGDAEAMRATLGQVIDLAFAGGFGDLLAQAALLLRPGVAIARRDDPLVLRALAEAEKLLGSEHDAIRVRLRSYLASSPPLIRDRAACLAMLEPLLADAQRLGGGWPLFDVLRAKFHAVAEPNDEAVALLGELLGLAERWRSRAMACETHYLAQHVRYMRGEMQAAQDALEAFREAGEQLRIRLARFSYARLIVAAELREGRIDSARVRYAPLCGEAVCHHPQMSDIFLWRTDLELARLEGAPIRAEKLVEPPAESELLVELLAIEARARAEGGDRAQAEKLLGRLAQNHFASLGGSYTWQASLCYLASAAIELGDRERAAELYQLLAPHEHLFAVDMAGFSLGSVHHFQGRLAALLGRPDQAGRHFEQALRANQRTGHRAAWLETERERERLFG